MSSSLTWGEAKELVEVALELDFSGQAIVKEIRRHTGAGLIESIHHVHGLLAVADHPRAQEVYESMRREITRLASNADWVTARFKLQRHLPTRELI